jgi:16S rRNA (cytosine1402-N4)-methyltransferase
MQTTPYHKPVLVDEVITYLAPKPQGVYVDVTFGGGGHTRAILNAEPTARVIALDWDETALSMNAAPLEQEFGARFMKIWGNFAQLPELLKKNKIGPVDGILADFGTSQFQLKEQEGFSFAADTFLDMRMAPSFFKITAYDIVNRSSEKELETIFRDYGEEIFARRIAHAIVEERRRKPIKTTAQLANIVVNVVPHKGGHKKGRHIHPATRVFQALRIVVNEELENIQALLNNSLKVLKPGGRIVCISFHSLEDRIVKQFFKAHKDQFEILTPKIVVPTEEECRRNPSARSSKLRAAELMLVPGHSE